MFIPCPNKNKSNKTMTLEYFKKFLNNLWQKISPFLSSIDLQFATK